MWWDKKNIEWNEAKSQLKSRFLFQVLNYDSTFLSGVSLMFIYYFLALGKVHGSIHDETKTAQSRKAIIRMLGKCFFFFSKR